MHYCNGNLNALIMLQPLFLVLKIVKTMGRKDGFEHTSGNAHAPRTLICSFVAGTIDAIFKMKRRSRYQDHEDMGKNSIQKIDAPSSPTAARWII